MRRLNISALSSNRWFQTTVDVRLSPECNDVRRRCRSPYRAHILFYRSFSILTRRRVHPRVNDARSHARGREHLHRHRSLRGASINQLYETRVLKRLPSAIRPEPKRFPATRFVFLFPFFSFSRDERRVREILRKRDFSPLKPRFFVCVALRMTDLKYALIGAVVLRIRKPRYFSRDAILSCSLFPCLSSSLRESSKNRRLSGFSNQVARRARRWRMTRRRGRMRSITLTTVDDVWCVL